MLVSCCTISSDGKTEYSGAIRDIVRGSNPGLFSVFFFSSSDTLSFTFYLMHSVFNLKDAEICNVVSVSSINFSI